MKASMPRTRRKVHRRNKANMMGAYSPPYHLRPSTLAARNAYATVMDFRNRMQQRMPHVRLPRLCMPMGADIMAMNSDSRQAYLQELHETQAAISGARKQRCLMAEALARSNATRSAVVLHRNPRFKSGANTCSTLACSNQNDGVATATATPTTTASRSAKLHDAVPTGALANGAPVPKDNSVQVIELSSGDGSSNETNTPRSRRLNSTGESSTTSDDLSINMEIVAKLNALQADIRNIKQLAAKVQQQRGRKSGVSRQQTAYGMMPPTARAANRTKTPTRRRRRGRQACPTLSTILQDMDIYIKSMSQQK